MTDERAAMDDPELAILSVLAHGLEAEGETIALHALRATQGLDEERRLLYSDLIYSAVSKATRAALEELMASKDYVFQSDFAKEHQTKGGRLARVSDLLAILEERGLSPTAEEREQITSCTDDARLARWIRRAVTTSSVAALVAE